MHSAVEQMLKKYNCKSVSDYENALKEIIQEIALVGMWRAKFFEVGAFYGGSSLRILYGLTRFSEDLGFSLLNTNKNFNINKYTTSLKRELAAFGFDVSIEKKHKNINTSIESAFIKANTLMHLIKINTNLKTHKDSVLKIKLEVDTDPPGDFDVETKTHFNPIVFSIKTFTLPTLFAGKIAAILYRPYKFNIKGRDWYDFLWYISRDTPINIKHLKSRLTQLKKWDLKQNLSVIDVKDLLQKRIDSLDIKKIQKDILPFVKDHEYIYSWSIDMFRDAVDKL